MNTIGEESEEKLQSEIKKEVEKLKYYVDNADEIIEEGDYNEIKIINSRAAVILDKIDTLGQVKEISSFSPEVWKKRRTRALFFYFLNIFPIISYRTMYLTTRI